MQVRMPRMQRTLQMLHKLWLHGVLALFLKLHGLINRILFRAAVSGSHDMKYIEALSQERERRETDRRMSERMMPERQRHGTKHEVQAGPRRDCDDGRHGPHR